MLTCLTILCGLFKFNIYFIFIADILYLILYFYLIYKLVKFNKDVWELVLLIVCIILPLVFIHPLGERLFFLPYVLVIILMFRVLDINKIIIKDYVWVRVSCFILYVFLLYVSIENYRCEVERDSFIKNNLDRMLIEVNSYKYPNYVWFDKIDGEYFGKYYNLYHGYDEKIRY